MRFSLFGFLILLIFFCSQSCKDNSKQKLLIKEDSAAVNTYQLKSSNVPFEAYVKYSGIPFREGGKIHLSYEINVFNSFNNPIHLNTLSIHDLANAEFAIQKYDSIYFDTYFERPGKEIETGDHTLFPSEFGTIYVDLSFADSLALPKKVFHRLLVDIRLSNGEILKTGVETAVIEIPAVTTTLLNPPFRNGKWMYVSTHHRDTRAVFDGEVHITQRHAIDWIALDEEGLYVSNDRSKNENWYTYGKEILAVADGTVVAVKDGIPENEAEADEMAVPMTRENFGGNWVLLSIGENQEVFYAHLIPGSLRVKPGDRVKIGDVLGLLGNSGNSDCPHLHMHLETDGGGVVKGEGVPFHFKEFVQLDRFSEEFMDDNIWAKNHWSPLEKVVPSLRINEYPRGEGVVEFK